MPEAHVLSDSLLDENIADDVEENATNIESSVVDDFLNAENDTKPSIATATVCPSHILPDGAFVHLPPPNEFERKHFFEMSVARHGLLQEDLQSTTKRSRKTNGDDHEKGDNEKKPKKGKVEPQIHPLALASARMQSNGINELNRAINLQTLVATGEYFGLSNIVDPSFDRVSGKPSSKVESGASGSRSENAAIIENIAGLTPGVSNEEEARVRAFYVLQRKGDVFRQANNTLKRHRRRLIAAIASQRQIDTRWRELRPFYRLAAPEHGTRALPHAVKTTELICADVDIYHLTGTPIGRLSCHVPRYASIELSENYTVVPDVKDWQIDKLARDAKRKETTGKHNDNDRMEIVDTVESENLQTTKENTSPPDLSLKKASRICTKAQPFAIADPTIGKVDTDFDPSKVTMLTLQFKIEKPSTGFSESVCLEPLAATLLRSDDISATISDEQRDDEQLLMRLQHSLFCAKLFESMRRELAPDMESVRQVRDMSAQTQSVAWLTGRSDENFLPPPSMMIGSNEPGLSPLCIIHVHDGDFKVLLDCEYNLNVKLVESVVPLLSGQEITLHNTGHCNDSGSQTPKQLRTLCQALLLHAQETYHRHSIQEQLRLNKEQQEKESKNAVFLQENPHVIAIPPVKKKEDARSPKSLQTCASLGAKLLFESRIRKALRKVKDWLRTSTSTADDELTVEWLVLPLFDLAAQFTVSFRSWYIDANIVSDELTVTSFGANGEYRKVTFHSDKQFEIYLKTAIRRALI